MHHVDRDTPWDEIWQAMEILVREGKVLYVGSSNFAAWHVAQANEAAARRHLVGLVSEQSLYNLATRTVELEVIPACRAYGVGILPGARSPAGCWAARSRRPAEGRRSSERAQKKLETFRAAARAVRAALRRAGREPRRRRPGLAPLPPRRDRAHRRPPHPRPSSTRRSRASELKLDEETLKALDEIWPGPGGEAPEAYAW